MHRRVVSFRVLLLLFESIVVSSEHTIDSVTAMMMRCEGICYVLGITCCILCCVFLLSVSTNQLFSYHCPSDMTAVRVGEVGGAYTSHQHYV